MSGPHSAVFAGAATRARAQERFRRLAPALLIVVSAAAYLFRIGAASLWQDESWSAMLVRTGLGQFVELVRAESGSQVLYYSLLRAWSGFGHSESWLRLPSALCAIAALVVCYRLALRLFDRNVALVALALLGVNPFFVFYAQEARGYTLATLLITAATLALVTAVESGRRRDWLGCALLASLAAYAHLLSIFVIVAHALALAALRPADRDRGGLLLAAGATAVLLTPLALLVWGGSGQVSGVAQPSLRDILDVAVVLAGNRGWLGNLVVALAWAAAGGAAVVVARRHGRGLQTWRWALVLAWSVVPGALALALSLTSPVLSARYLIVALPGLCLLAALGLARLSDPRVLGVVLLVVLVASGARIVDRAGAVRYDEDWRTITHAVLTDAQPGDRLVFYVPWASIPFQYAALRHHTSLEGLSFYVPGDGWVPLAQVPRGGRADAADSVRSGLPTGSGEGTAYGWVRVYEPADLRDLRGADDTVWLLSTGTQEDVSLADVTAALEATHRLEETETVGRVTVARYEPVRP
ncbi:MAG TPA: glycosyltransferase family 39 protein [Egibacteraceae bacterium]